VPGEYDSLQRLLEQDEELLGFVKDRIRWVHSKHDRHSG
jgi:hypothetical protein